MYSLPAWLAGAVNNNNREFVVGLRSLIQPRLDYCSQLWSPRDQSAINRLESVQRQFISQIRDASLVGMNYWERLSHLRVYSQERRRERYQICFLWKQTQGLIHGYELKWQWSDRRGRLAVPNRIPRDAPSRVKKARERSLGGTWCPPFQPSTQQT